MKKLLKKIKDFFANFFTKAEKLAPVLEVAVKVTNSLKTVTESDRAREVKEYLKQAIPSNVDNVVIDSIWYYLKSAGFEKLRVYVNLSSAILNTMYKNKRLILAIAAINGDSSDNGEAYRVLSGLIAEAQLDGKITFDELAKLCGEYYDKFIKPKKYVKE